MAYSKLNDIGGLLPLFFCFKNRKLHTILSGALKKTYRFFDALRLLRMTPGSVIFHNNDTN